MLPEDTGKNYFKFMRMRAHTPLCLANVNKYQVDPTKKETDLDSPLKVMPKYKMLGQ